MITDFEIYRIRTPLGRVVGDNSCSYDELDVLAIALYTSEGLVGWGYSESMSKGNFRKPAWWIRPLPPLAKLKELFKVEWVPVLVNKDPFELRNERLYHTTSYPYFDGAVRLALWDLMAQKARLPLYRLLGGKPEHNKARAYASILDFPLSNEEAYSLTRMFAEKGFDIIKVKIGGDDPCRDLDRLRLVQEAFGKGKTMNADANQAWDWQTTLSRLDFFSKHGVHLEYIEDPLPKNDIDGLVQLTRRCPIPVVGHDYSNNIPELRKMLEVGGLQGLRSGKDIDFLIGCSELALEYQVPLYLVNSLFEVNVHAAASLPGVARMEFAHLGWNDLMMTPIKIEEGYATAPDCYGHGLIPDLEKVRQLCEESMAV